jgi:hypothetical protein
VTRRLLATALAVAGVLLLAFGLLFVLQGAGVVRWPADSFMIDARAWVVRGLLVMAAGAAALLASRRLR